MQRKLVLRNGVEISQNSKCFIIAEIGQNHQGDINVAKHLIKAAKECGADCVKFQKTSIEHKFNKRALQRSYFNEHSFGKTYGEHKKFLEFQEEVFWELQAYADVIGIMFAATAMDLESLKLLIRMKTPFIKIGSGDSNNPLLIEEAAKANVPLIISTGMCSLTDATGIYTRMGNYHKNFALLHCVSAYPTPPQDVNLRVIRAFEEQFPDIIIGYSGHELNIDISVAAVAMGAKILERHITVDRAWRGSDHACSLEPREFTNMVKKVRAIEKALGCPTKMVCGSEFETMSKLRKVIVLNNPVKAGTVLGRDDLAIKVADPRGGLDGLLINRVIGKTVKVDVNKDEPLMSAFLWDVDDE